MEGIFRDEIETMQIDKFFCNEMGRQIHRYIKARGSLKMLEKIEEHIQNFSVHDREKAMARYIDRNRKVVENLDWQMLVARAMANFCDSFNYFIKMVADKATMDFYVDRMKKKYIRFHSVYEENGKYGLKDHEGEVMLKAEYDFLRTPFIYVDDLISIPVIAEKDGKMGLVQPGPDGGSVVLPFEYDNIALRDEEPWFELTKDGKTTLWSGVF